MSENGPGARLCSRAAFPDKSCSYDCRTDAASAYVGYQPLAEHFAGMLLVGARSSYREEQVLEQAFINQLNPDVVIEERAERTLRWVPAMAQ